MKRGRDEGQYQQQGEYYSSGYGYSGAPQQGAAPVSVYDAPAAYPASDPQFATPTQAYPPAAAAPEQYDRRVRRRAEAKNTLRIRIAKDNASKVIGKGGTLIQSMTRQSGAHVNFLPADGSFQIGQISGSADAIIGYLELVLYHLSRFATPEQKAAGDNLVLLVPASKIGSIIGKGGILVRNIQMQTGVKVQVSPRPDGGAPDVEQDVTLSGTSEGIAMAVRTLVHQLFPDGSGGGPSGPSPFAAAPPMAAPWAPAPPVASIYGAPMGLARAAVRSASTGKEIRFALRPQEVSRIIGKAGSGIRDLCKRSGTSIVFDNTVQPSLGSIPGQAREALGPGQIGIVRGEPEVVIGALKIICEKLGEPAEPRPDGKVVEPVRAPGQVRLIIMVPSTQIGFIMGKKGASVLEAKERTGANINISPRQESVWDQAAGVGLQACIIDGNVDQVSKAVAWAVAQLTERKSRKGAEGGKPEV